MEAEAVLNEATNAVRPVEERFDAADVEVGHVGGGSDVFEVFGRQEPGVGHLGREALIKSKEFHSQFLHQAGYLEGVGHPGVADELVGRAVSSDSSCGVGLVGDRNPVMADDGLEEQAVERLGPLDVLEKVVFFGDLEDVVDGFEVAAGVGIDVGVGLLEGHGLADVAECDGQAFELN